MGGVYHLLTAELLFQEVEILDMNTIRDTRTGKYAKQPKVGLSALAQSGGGRYATSPTVVDHTHQLSPEMSSSSASSRKRMFSASSPTR